MDELAAVLRRERELLDQLRFRFVEARLLLAAREIRYLRWANAEISEARRRATETDLLRAAAVERIHASRGRRRAITLRKLAAENDEPWAGILRDHHEGLCTVVAEIEVIGHRNAELARAGIRQLALTSPPSPLDPWLHLPPDASDGPDAPSPVITAVLDIDDVQTDATDVTHLAAENAYQEVITVASRLRMPALLAFLR